MLLDRFDFSEMESRSIWCFFAVVFFGEGVREQYPPYERKYCLLHSFFRLSHARSLLLIPAPIASLRLSCK